MTRVTEGIESGSDVVFGDEAIFVLIDHLEGLSQTSKHLGLEQFNLMRAEVANLFEFLHLVLGEPDVR